MSIVTITEPITWDWYWIPPFFPFFFFASFLFFLPTKQIFCLLNGNVILLFSQATLVLCFLYSASTLESSPHLSHFYLLPVMFIFIRMLRGHLASSFFCFSSSVGQHCIFSVQHVPALSFLLYLFSFIRQHSGYFIIYYHFISHDLKNPLHSARWNITFINIIIGYR